MTTIMGPPLASADQLHALAWANGPDPRVSDWETLASLYIEEGDAEGVTGDLAFAQAIHETGWFQFGSDVLPAQNNFAGIGAVGGGAHGASFPDVRTGIRAQIQHLVAYATKGPLHNPTVDPRFQIVVAAKPVCPTWESLDGEWAVPGKGYGEAIVTLRDKALTMTISPLAAAFIPGYNGHTSGTQSQCDRIVIHGTVSATVRGGARAVAQYFTETSAGGLAHYCLTPENRVLTTDLRWVPLGDLRPGDELIGCDEESLGPRPRLLRPSDVERVERRWADCVTVLVSDGREVTCSTDHWWLRRSVKIAGTSLHGRGPSDGSFVWTAAADLLPGDPVQAPARPWGGPTPDLLWLGGLIDGEGSMCNQYSNKALVCSQKPGRVWDRMADTLDAQGWRWSFVTAKDSGVKVAKVGVLSDLLALLGQTRPTRFIDEPRLWEGRAMTGRGLGAELPTVLEVRPAGRREVVAIRTSTGTYIGEGFAMHNCVDPGEIIACAQEEVVCWHAPPNQDSIGIELCDPQGVTAIQANANDPARWQDADHQAMLAETARLVVDVATRWRVPLVEIHVPDLLAGLHGICGHVDVAQAWHQSNHTDPGPDYPWAQFMSLVTGSPTPPPPVHSGGDFDEVLMAIVQSDDDARRTKIREWCEENWGYGAMSLTDQNTMTYVLATTPADLTLAHIVDHPKAAAFRAKRGW